MITFPLGPFRNLGDFRLWIVGSVLWLAGATVYAFLLEPPFNCLTAMKNATAIYEMAALSMSKCGRMSVDVARWDYVEQLAVRLAVIIIPPLAFVGSIWLVVAAFRWVRQGYRAPTPPY